MTNVHISIVSQLFERESCVGKNLKPYYLLYIAALCWFVSGVQVLKRLVFLSFFFYHICKLSGKVSCAEILPNKAINENSFWDARKWLRRLSEIFCHFKDFLILSDYLFHCVLVIAIQKYSLNILSSTPFYGWLKNVLWWISKGFHCTA